MEIDITLIEKELNKLKKKKPDVAKVIINYLVYLRHQGYDVSRPKDDQLQKGIYELRPLDYRVLYTYVEDKAIVLVLCEKKQSEVPRRCIDFAIERLKRFSNK